MLPVNSVLLSSRASIGLAAINKVPMATNQGFKSLIPKDGVIDHRFLYWWIVSNRESIERLGRGATFKEISKPVTAAIEIPLPPIEEQRRIAAVLDQAEKLRAKRWAALAMLDSLTESIFIGMFGDPATNPRGWPMRPLSELASQITDGEHKTPDRSTEGVKLLSARNVRDGFLDLSHVDYVSPEVHARLSVRCKPSPGDILISCSGTIGRVARIKTPEPLSLVRSVALVRPRIDQVRSVYLEHYLRTSPLRQWMVQRANASSQANLFQNQIKELPVVVPELSRQIDFEALVTCLTTLRTSVDSGTHNVDDLFSSLQQRAFQGAL
jgi:type I restriction enzyme S subunit